MAVRPILSHILRLGRDWDSKELILGAFQNASADEKSLQTFLANEDIGRISMSALWSRLEERDVQPVSSTSTWLGELHEQFAHGSKIPRTWFDDDKTPSTSPLHAKFSLDPSKTFLGSKRVVGQCNLVPEDGDFLVLETNVSRSIILVSDEDLPESLTRFPDHDVAGGFPDNWHKSIGGWNTMEVSALCALPSTWSPSF